MRPMRAVAWAGVALNAVFVGAWLLSRTVGLPLVDSLRGGEPAGTQDVIAAALGATAVAAALLSVVQPVRRATLETGWVIASVLAVTFVAVPAMAADTRTALDTCTVTARSQLQTTTPVPAPTARPRERRRTPS
jgi:hypothetical protein